jgi:hypothetical protein
MTIKDHIQGTANFVYFRDSALWYRTSTGLLFPVPLDEIGTTTFEAEHKGIYLMRWIRKYLETLDAANKAA